MDERIISVQKMQDYIESNYEEKITMSALSKVSGFSPWFAYRLFKHYTGLTPSQYARKIKLSKSVLMLKQEGCKVIEAAYNSGFESVDGYQRAFYREFGCNPGSFSEKPVPVCMFVYSLWR